MSIRSLKNLLGSLTDFEFLASIDVVDFQKKTVKINKRFFNTLIGTIKTHVQIRTDREIGLLVKNIKEIYFRRLALVSSHSFVRYFIRNIKIAFSSFRRRLNKFFKPTEEQAVPVQKKNKNRRKKKTTVVVPPQQRTPSPVEVVVEQKPMVEESSESEESEDNSSVSEISESRSEFDARNGLDYSDEEPILDLEEFEDAVTEYSEDEESIYSSNSSNDSNCISGYGESTSFGC